MREVAGERGAQAYTESVGRLAALVERAENQHAEVPALRVSARKREDMRTEEGSIMCEATGC
jgi:hypothetical protein